MWEEMGYSEEEGMLNGNIEVGFSLFCIGWDGRGGRVGGMGCSVRFL